MRFSMRRLMVILLTGAMALSCVVAVGAGGAGADEIADK